MTMAAAAAADAAAPRRRTTVHLNHAGASPCPPVVLDRVVRHLRDEQHSGGYAAIGEGTAAAEELRRAYGVVAELLNAGDSGEIALVESATVAWTRLFYSFARHMDRRTRTRETTEARSGGGGVILVSQVEYAANLVAAAQWARSHPPGEWTVKMIPSKADKADGDESGGGKTTGIVDVDALDGMLANIVASSSSAPATATATATDSEGDEDGDFSSTAAAAATDDNTPTNVICCVTHIPTNSGVVNPVEEIGDTIEKYNNLPRQRQDEEGEVSGLPRILYLVDACQSVGQMDVDVSKIKCHGLVATGRKYLRGPRGTGFLYVNSNLLRSSHGGDGDDGGDDDDDLLWPDHVDHFSVPVMCVPDRDNVLQQQQREEQQLSPGVVDEVTTDVQDILSFRPRSDARRFEFWESNVAGKLGLGSAINYLIDKGVDKVAQEIRTLANYLYERLNAIDGVVTHYRPQSGIVTFWTDGIDASHIKDEMWVDKSADDKDADRGGCGVIRFEVSLVPATSTPLDSSLAQVPVLLRASVSYTNTREEIDLFCDRLTEIIAESAKQQP